MNNELTDILRALLKDLGSKVDYEGQPVKEARFIVSSGAVVLTVQTETGAYREIRIEPR